MDKRGIILVILAIVLVGLIGCKEEITPEPGETGCAAMGSQEAKDSCYLEQVNTERITNIDFCDNIASAGSKEKCYVVIFNSTKNTVNCSLVEGELISDTCNMIIGAEKMDITICGRIINLGKRDQCYYGIASRQGFPPELQDQICSKINDVEMRGECQKFVDYNDKRY